MINITVNGIAYSVPSSAADTNWAANQIAFEQALATTINSTITSVSDLTTLLETTTWTAVSAFTNSWANLGGADQPAQHTKTPAGIVMVRAAISSGGGGPGASAFTLPVGRRPLTRQRFICPAGTSGEFCAAVLVNTDGTVVISPGVGTAAGDIRNGTFLQLAFSTTA